MVRMLLWIGLIARRQDGSIAYPVRVAPRWVFRSRRTLIGWIRLHAPVYVFRNLPGVIKWKGDRLLPRRWGVGFFGLIEIGDRGH